MYVCYIKVLRRFLGMAGEERQSMLNLLTGMHAINLSLSTKDFFNLSRLMIKLNKTLVDFNCPADNY